MKIVVTGAAGGLGRTLIPRLCARSDVSRVIGIDRTAPPAGDPKFSFHPADIREKTLERLVDGVDAIVHLAFVLAPGTMTVAQMRDNNVSGSLNVFRAARAAQVRKIVNLSSASVYGSGENLDETAPLAPSPLFPYARHKAELERASNSEFPEIDIVHLRPTFILGPNATPLLRRMFTARVHVAPRRPHPRVQVVHEEDVATAIMLALDPGVRSGVFNLAAEEITTLPKMIRNGRVFVFGVPIGLVERFLGEPPRGGDPRPMDTMLELLRVTLTVSCRCARETLGWEPRRGIWEARAGCVRRGGGR